MYFYKRAYGREGFGLKIMTRRAHHKFIHNFDHLLSFQMRFTNYPIIYIVNTLAADPEKNAISFSTEMQNILYERIKTYLLSWYRKIMWIRALSDVMS